MCEKRPKRERVCRALSALSTLSDLSLSANACYYVSKRDAYMRCICVRVCVYLFSQLTKSFLFRFKERNVPEERKEEKERQKNRTKKRGER
mgnify:CR=1 FL=1